MENIADKDNLVVFRTSQGVEVRGNLLRLSRYLVVIEIYNPNIVLQTSEALSDFKIVWNNRTLYAGKAVVQNLVNTGLVTVCEATLGDSWCDVDFSLVTDKTGKLRDEFNGFFQEWQKLYRIAPEYKVVVADLQTFLTDLRLWLEQVELGIRSSPLADRQRLERNALEQLQASVVPAINGLFERFEAVSQGVEEELRPAHHVFGKRQVHPLLLCSPFVYRTLQKPLGYAGDYEMVNMMFREPCEGSSLFAKLVNTYALQLPPIIAHRNRVEYLIERLTGETLRAVRQNRMARVYNLGCGPAQEVQRFLKQSHVCNHSQLTLADFNDETVMHTSKVLMDLKRRHGRHTAIEVKKQSVQEILKGAAKRSARPAGNHYDLIYCAGLFDYLSDKICAKLLEYFYDALAPGGLLIATNVDLHPSRGEMECFLEWHLVYRSSAQLAALAPRDIPPENLSLKQDSTGVNIFMEIRKPNGEP